VIRLAPGTYAAGEFIPHDLELVGVEGDEVTILDGGDDLVIGAPEGAHLSIKGLTIANGRDRGVYGVGGIISYGTLRLVDSTIRDCTANNFAAGVLHFGVPSGDAVIQRCKFYGNTGTSLGGFNSGGTLTVKDCEFVGNEDGPCLSGWRTTTFVSDSAFYGNEWIGYLVLGGGNAPLHISNTTIADNVSGALSFGDPGATPHSLRHVTVTNNGKLPIAGLPSDLSGGLDLPIGAPSNSIEIFASIIAGNRYAGRPQDIRGDGVTSLGYNLIGADHTGVWGGGAVGDLVGTEAQPIAPVMAPLGFYGGLTQSRPPLLGSPAIGAGPPVGFEPFDQRGLPRGPVGSDIGSVRVSLGEYLNVCDPNPNSTGAPGEIFGLGSASAFANQFELQLASLPPGAIVIGITSMDAGVTPNPAGSSGVLCLAGAIGRFVGPGEVQTADLAGLATIPVNLTSIPQPLGSLPAVAGSAWHFQAWHRDTSPTGGTSNFTRSLLMRFL
jgi:hypothetical protein